MFRLGSEAIFLRKRLMVIILSCVVVLIFSGLSSAALNRHNKWANNLGSAGGFGACLMGFIALFLVQHPSSIKTIEIPWGIPDAFFRIELDAVGSVFLFPIFLLSGLAAFYGRGYLCPYAGSKNIGTSWFFFNLLIACMILVVTARNAILFLVAWEMMAISSFFLVLFEGERKEVARAGLIYLVATHIGTIFLLVMFILLAQMTGSFDFADWHIPSYGVHSAIIFLCAVIGFGTKAGFIPMHIWLPEAHPAAPSHVSAVMSGVMIKTGIYGIIRVVTFFDIPLSWWGYLLVGIGILSGVLGILFALAQRDLKRLLAYSSIENIGIIAIGVGLGMVGMSSHNPVLTVLGFTGGLWHVVNHALMKGTLFLGAGIILHEAHTRDLDVLGGLWKRMPITGFCFLIGSASICALPSLNGFIGEFLIYWASLKGLLGEASSALISLGTLFALAFIGGLAVACFTKTFGILFLGEPRGEHSQNARDPEFCMRFSVISLALGCVTVGLSAPLTIGFWGPVLMEITGILPKDIEPILIEITRPLIYICALSSAFYFFVGLLILWRRWLLRNREIGIGPTWDCGYARPGFRMQYTASSFSQPIVDFFKGILRTQKHTVQIKDYFPTATTFKTETRDLFTETLFRPVYQFFHRLADRMSCIQHGILQIYILYILLTLVVLFIWKLSNGT